ncbi:MAG TPA: pantetheine-phosphate adenylyltransferase [Verrucomicrobiales bacterium]|jgi:pantetheine-phosphate adenylyltransferase|nr:pantetheine-phosphate adenylyltransferase [Verrucomicrobiales bacterium]HIL68481.1 pantetheine-phosphate adenylyltransferase [Verrucomicrobiota bacterium]
MRIGIYPGSFDPLTNGHLDLIQRASKLFDHLIIAIVHSETKKSLLSMDRRKDLVSQSIQDLENVEVDTFRGLLVDFVKKRSGTAILRGLRAVSDFEFEFQLAVTNRKLCPEVETIFMMPNDSFTFLSSSIVKEIASLHGDVGQFVPPPIQKALLEAYSKD